MRKLHNKIKHPLQTDAIVIKKTLDKIMGSFSRVFMFDNKNLYILSSIRKNNI